MRRHGFHDLVRRRPGKHIQAMCILALRLQPAFQTGDRGQRDKRTEVRQFVAQLVNHLFDQKVAERNSAQPFLAILDRVKHSHRSLHRVVQFTVVA